MGYGQKFTSSELEYRETWNFSMLQQPQQSVLPSSPQQALPVALSQALQQQPIDPHQLQPTQQLQQQQPQQQFQQGQEHSVVNEELYENISIQSLDIVEEIRDISEREEGEITDDSPDDESINNEEWITFTLSRIRNTDNNT